MAGLSDRRDDLRAWLPIRVWRPPRDEWRVDWCRFGDHPLREPFFHDSVEAALRRPFNRAFRRLTGIDALLDWQERSPGLAPAAFVFHASRCGSTLMAQALAQLDTHVVLSEPSALDALLRAHYLEPALAERQPAWIRALLSAYGQRRRGVERTLVVKPDAWNIGELPLLRRCFPGAACLFLYRDPLEIVASHLQAPGRHMVPGMLGASPLALSAEQAPTLSRPAFVARQLGRLLEAGADACARHGAIAVNYDELPEAIGARLAPLFALDAAGAARAGAGMPHHAKRPTDPFRADHARKRQSADAETRSEVERWAMPAYAALEALRREQRRQPAGQAAPA